jgi:phage shock protein C
MAKDRLDRPRRGDGRIIAGVCRGIADHYGFSPFLVRLLFVIFAITGASELAYLVLWILMPKRSRGAGVS